MITAAPPAALPAPAIDPVRGFWRVVPYFTRLRWRLLAANMRGAPSLAWGTALGMFAAAAVGMIGGGSLWATGRSSDSAQHLAPTAMAGLVFLVAALGVAAGVAQAVDPRVIATEPLRSRDATLGQLVLVATGPAGISAAGLGIGFLGGWTRGFDGLAIVVLAVVAWLLSMLLVSRGLTAALGLLTVRHPRAGQLVAGFAVLGAYAVSQILPRVAGRLDQGGRERMAGWARWTPPGQLGDALAKAPDQPAEAWLHLAAGAAWLPILAVATHVAMHRMRTAQPRPDLAVTGEGRFWGVMRSWCGEGPTGAAAFRSIAVRLRSPREILQAVIGTAIGLGVALGPVVATSGGESSVVLVGGAVQLAVLLTAGNSLGADGPALASEILAGLDGKTLATAKARSITIVGLPLLLVPLLPAALTGAWHLVPAGMLVALGAIAAGTGGAIVQSAYAPIALPEADNPFASGDAGRGCLVGVLTGVSLLIQALLALPVGAAIYFLMFRVSTETTTAIAGAAVPFGFFIRHVGIRLAARRIDRFTPELLVEITPAR